MKTIAVILLVIAAALSVSACDDTTNGGGSDDTYPHGVIFIPPMSRGGTLTPIFY